LSIIDVRTFRGADCDTDHYLVVEKVRERLAVRKQEVQKTDGGRFNLRKLNDLEVRKQYQNSPVYIINCIILVYNCHIY